MKFKNLKRDIKIDNILFTEGTEVNLKLGASGVIKEVIRDRLDWFPYKVLITETNGIFHEVGEIIECNSNDFVL